MQIEAVLVCVDYSDLLQITLPNNLRFFDRINVVTKESDERTIDICNKYNVDITITNRMNENSKDYFNKGKAINEGIKNLAKNDWLVILDADMTFSNNFRECLEKVNDIESVYGVPRYMCKTHDDWLEYVNNENVAKSWQYQGKRINIGVGFFQMANFNSSVMKEMTQRMQWYSEGFGHCGRSDRFFWRSWPDYKRFKIDNAYGIHLGDDTFKANWYGRTTQNFM